MEGINTFAYNVCIEMTKPIPDDIKIKGYETIRKVAGKRSGNSAYVYLPAKWAGKKIAVILLEPIE